jgi:hypothetical protein
VKVVDRLQLYVEQVSNQAMRIRFVAYTVELQIRIAEPSLSGLPAELRTLRELDDDRCLLNAVLANLARIADRIEKVRR